MIISRSVLLRMRNVADRSRENQNIHFMIFSIVYEIMWKNIAGSDRPQTTI